MNVKVRDIDDIFTWLLSFHYTVNADASSLKHRARAEISI